MITIRQIRCFLSVVNQGSMNKASVALNMSQQSLSSSMKALEEDLDVSLFRRSNKGVVLTEEGQIFNEFASTTWTNFVKMRNRFHPEIDDRKSVTLRIGTIDFLSKTFLPPFLIEFSRNYPWIKLQVYDEPMRGMLRLIDQGRLDVALVLQLVKEGVPLFDFDENIMNYQIGECRSYCWVSSNSPIAMQQSISLKQVAAGPLLMLESTDEDLALSIYEGYETNICNFPLSTDMHMIVELVANNMAICPDVKVAAKELSMARMFHGLPVVPLPVRMPSTTRMNVRAIGCSECYSSEAQETFLNELLRYAGSAAE